MILHTMSVWISLVYRQLHVLLSYLVVQKYFLKIV